MALHTITISTSVWVPPVSATPTKILPFSSIDRCNRGHLSIDIVTVYTRGVQAAACIKDAFAKALVHYYPVAGKITKVKPGKPEVNCTSEGIWFVEANANCSLEEVKYLEWPLMIPKEQLLPQAPLNAKLQDEIIMIQVTEFTCGGFTIGMRMNHLVFDGQGCAQFLKAVGEMSRGLPEPTVKPVWSRDSIPEPPQVPHSTNDSTIFNFTTSVFDISLESINRTKDLYVAATGQRSSTFDVVTAMILKCRTRAIDLMPEAEVRLACAASTRHLLHGILPSVEGYYGNCLYPIFLTKCSEEINNASLVEVMSLIKDAKESHSTRFLNWVYGHNTESIQTMPLDYGSMAVTDWRKIGFNEVDFGWGPPRYVFPSNMNLSYIALATYLKPPRPEKGVRLMLCCVKEEHSALFHRELSKLA